MRSKQNRCEAITPRKQTPKSNKMQVSSRKGNETTSIKDFLPPFLQNVFNTLPSLTPSKKQPQFLLSPSPVKKDLFSQLLGSEIKNLSPYNNNHLQQSSMIMEEQDNQYIDDETIKSNSDQNSQISDSDNQCYWQEQNGIKKRKRKSTVQIKILKQELEGEINWTKQKIVKMAEITGLSQSQVYKWCWDQKKKNMKLKDPYRRKMIKKQFGSKVDLTEKKQYNEQLVHRKQFGEYDFVEIRTKPKVSSVLQQSDVNTEKKINKKLIFN